MDVVLVLAVAAVVVWVVGRPLLASQRARAEAGESAEREELEALKEAKYREIRDAELDYRTGKLSEADWRATDRALRAEAVVILRRIDELDGQATF
jgi:flagellar biosynthesis/type III secretory pathway M-ring protein FliF/YscJ